MTKTVKNYVSMIHFGEYEKWNRNTKKLPNIKKITDEILAEIDTEFGYTLLIKQQKGKTLNFVIEHPPFTDESGEISPAFTGELIIPQNTYRFYLGDCIWAPLDDKLGAWRLITYIENTLVADKTLFLKDKNSTEFDLDW